MGTLRSPSGMARWILGKGTAPLVSEELVGLPEWLVGVKVAAPHVRRQRLVNLVCSVRPLNWDGSDQHGHGNPSSQSGTPRDEVAKILRRPAATRAFSGHRTLVCTGGRV